MECIWQPSKGFTSVYTRSNPSGAIFRRVKRPTPILILWKTPSNPAKEPPSYSLFNNEENRGTGNSVERVLELYDDPAWQMIRVISF